MFDLYISCCLGVRSFWSEIGPDQGPAQIGPDRTGPLWFGRLENSILGSVPGWTGGPMDRPAGCGTVGPCQIAAQRPAASLVGRSNFFIFSCSLT